jgi:hypothetical protein
MFSSQKTLSSAVIAEICSCAVLKTSPEKDVLPMAMLLVVRFVRKKQEKEKIDMIFNKDKDEHELLVGVTKINPEEFIALAKILDVNMSLVYKETGAYTLRDAEEVLNDIVFAFRKLKHKERKMILKAVKNSGSSA